MKKILFLTFIFIYQNSATAQTSDSTYNAINSVNFTQYINKPIDSILSVLPINYLEIKLYGHLTSNKVRYLAIEYAGGTQIYLFVKYFSHMNPVDPNRIWDLNLFKLENLSQIIMFHPDFASKAAP